MNKQNLPDNHKNPPAQQRQNKQERVVATRAEFYSGPLPHPQMLEKYDQISPGAAAIIIGMAEKQTNHRIDIENKVVASQIQNSKRGQVFAFTLELCALISSFILFMFDKGPPAYVVFGTSVMSLVVTFIYATRSNRKELHEKHGR